MVSFVRPFSIRVCVHLDSYDMLLLNVIDGMENEMYSKTTQYNTACHSPLCSQSS